MNFDLRFPVGMMFTVFGLILVGTGLFGGPDLIHKSLDINMNLDWGIVMTLFGAFMLTMAFRAKSKTR